MDDIKKTAEEIKDTACDKAEAVVAGAKGFFSKHSKAFVMAGGAAIGALLCGAVGYLLGKGTCCDSTVVVAETMDIDGGNDDDIDHEEDDD